MSAQADDPLVSADALAHWRDITIEARAAHAALLLGEPIPAGTSHAVRRRLADMGFAEAAELDTKRVKPRVSSAAGVRHYGQPMHSIIEADLPEKLSVWPKYHYHVPVNDVELRRLRTRWVVLDRKLQPYAGHWRSKGAREILEEQKAVCKAIHHANLDKGGPEGIRKPGGPRDVVIIGAGPAGLAASIYGALEHLDVLLVDGAAGPGGQAGYSSRIENVIGFPAGVSGKQLAEWGLEQAQRAGAETKFSTYVTSVHYDPVTGLKTIDLSTGEHIKSRSVIIAGGVQFNRIPFEGSDSPGVVYGDTEALIRLASNDQGDGISSAVIVGGGNSAGQAAIAASAALPHVDVLIRGERLKEMSAYLVEQLESAPNVRIHYRAEIESVQTTPGGRVLRSVKLKDGTVLPAATVGLFTGSKPNVSWANVDLDERGFVKTGAAGARNPLETSLPGVYAAGDVRSGTMKRVAVAAGEGAMALSYVFQEVGTPGVPYLETVLAEKGIRRTGGMNVADIPNDVADHFMELVHRLDYEVVFTGVDEPLNEDFEPATGTKDRVRSIEGQRFYDQPIGTIIRPDLPGIGGGFRPALGFEAVPYVPFRHHSLTEASVLDVARTLAHPDPAPKPEAMEIVEADTEFDIPVGRFEEMQHRIALANRRAERAGIPDRFTLTVTETYDKRTPMKDAFGNPSGVHTVEERMKVKLNTPAVKHEGYTFVATLSWDEEAGLIARVAPGQTLGATRPKARECDICKSIRDRKDTFIIRDADGHTQQVGRNCLQQYMGITPAGLWMLGFADELGNDYGGEEREYGGGFGGGEIRYRSQDAMALAAAVVEDSGWVSRGNAEVYNKPATADLVREILGPPARGKDADSINRWRSEMMANAEDKRDYAQAVIDMARDLDGDSDYVINVRALAGAESVTDRNLPTFISAIVAKMRRDEEFAKRVAADPNKVSKHLGAVGDKIGTKKGQVIPPISARVTMTRVFEGQYGNTTLISMVDEDGNVLKWFASGNLMQEYKLGDPVLITGGSVKSHGEYRGVAETVLTRVKMEVTSAEAIKKAAEADAVIKDAESRGDPTAPGMDSLYETTGPERYGVIARLQPGTRVRAYDGRVQVKQGRKFVDIDTFRTGEIVSIEPEPVWRGNVGDFVAGGRLTLRDENGEEFDVHSNSIRSIDMSTLMPVVESDEPRVPAGMQAYDLEPMEKGDTVRWLDKGQPRDGAFRRDYQEATVSQFYAQPDGESTIWLDNGETLRSKNVVAYRKGEPESATPWVVVTQHWKDGVRHPRRVSFATREEAIEYADSIPDPDTDHTLAPDIDLPYDPERYEYGPQWHGNRYALVLDETKARHVRTPEGQRVFNQPIGSIITDDVPDPGAMHGPHPKPRVFASNQPSRRAMAEEDPVQGILVMRAENLIERAEVLLVKNPNQSFASAVEHAAANPTGRWAPEVQPVIELALSMVPPRRIKVATAEDLKTRAIAGGFTFDPRTGKHVEHGYVVAVPGVSDITPTKDFDSDVLESWIDKHIDAITKNPDMYLGGWRDDEHDEIVLDQVEVFTDRETAIRLGTQRGEQAIWDLDANAPIETGGTGGRDDIIGKEGKRAVVPSARGLEDDGPGGQEGLARGDGGQAQGQVATKDRVRTPGGADQYGQPIGSIIKPDVKPLKRRIPPLPENVWASQAPQYDRPDITDRTPGIHEWTVPPELVDGIEIHTLLSYDKQGKLRGVLSYYPNGSAYGEEPGDMLVLVDPKRQRRGIGTALTRAAMERWPSIDLAGQNMTPDGFALNQSILHGKPGTKDRVASAAGVEKYGEPIGTVITADVVERAVHMVSNVVDEADGVHVTGMRKLADDDAEGRAEFHRITGMPIPPAYKECEISNDLEHAAMLLRAKNAKGDWQYLYSVAHSAAAAAEKFQRGETVALSMPKLDKALEKDVLTDDTAAAVLVMRKMGIRVGSTADTHAKVKAYGATTLQARHVQITPAGSVIFDFIGKKGVHIHLVSKDQQLRAAMERVKEGKRGTQSLFDTNDGRTIKYIREATGLTNIKNHDLRTHLATVTALSEIKKIKRGPRSLAEYKRMRNAVGDAVSKRLGNNRTEALKAYIPPTVFAPWEGAVGGAAVAA